MEGIQVSTSVAGSQNQISIIKVGGFIDTTTSSEVERSLNSLLKQNRFNVIIDLGNVDYISSAGWGIFISEIKSIREHSGDLKLVKMIPDVYEIFELLEFHHILDVYDSVDEAVQKFETGGGPAAHFPKQQVAESTFSAPAETIIEPEVSQRTVDSPQNVPSSPAAAQETSGEEKPLVMRSVEDKIKYIIMENPNFGAYKINKMLNSEKFAYTKVGWFGVRAKLNQLGLGSRKSRKQFVLNEV